MPTTKEELIDGLRLVLREGTRVMSGFGPDDWKQPALGGDGEGWDRKQVYCHLAALAEITPGLLGGFAKLPEGQDAAAGMDIDAVNAQLVGAKAQLSKAELMAAFRGGFEKLIDFVRTVPEDQLLRSAKFGPLEGPAVDVMDSILVLHSMAHIYGAGGSPLG